MSDLTRDAIERMAASALADAPLSVTPCPWFDTEEERREWASDYVADLAGAGLIADDPDERAFAVDLVDRTVPMVGTPGALLRYLVFGGLGDGCFVAEVGLAGDASADLRDAVGAADPTAAVTPFATPEGAGVESLTLGPAAVSGGRVLERAAGLAQAALLRDLPGLGTVAVQASAATADVVLLARGRLALRAIVTDADLPAALAAAVTDFGGLAAVLG